ncbi:MAG: hypothetical protein P4L68_00830 [Methylovirgula sp.]|nr:hypothetical protein [Methylovirgula sp.]
MQFIRCCLAGAALLAFATAPASAHFHQRAHCWQTGPGLVLKMSNYQQPDGSYDALADLVRDVNGTPCGVDCPAPSRVLLATPPTVYCAPN